MRQQLFSIALLAGGLATRLKPLTQTVPKSLIDVDGKPFIDHQLGLLRENGASKVTICAGHLGEMIKTHVRDGREFGLEVSYSFDGSRLLGTAGAIKRALPLLDETFFVLYGDSYLTCNYGQIQEEHACQGLPALMTVYQNSGRWDSSNVEFVGGKIIAYDKQHPTPGMRHIDYGLGIFQRSSFGLVSDAVPCDLATLYQILLSRNQLAGVEVRQRFYEIGSFAGLEETRAYLRGRAILPEQVEG